MDEGSPAALHVVAGVLRDIDGRVLLAERPAGKHLAGGWEFPGGKLDAGETRFEGLARELDEEIGVTVGAAHPLIRVRYRYPEREVLLDVWNVTRHRGAPVGLDGQRLRWCDLDSLTAGAMLPADRPVVTALRLPERLTSIETPAYRICGAVELAGTDAASANGGDRGAELRLHGVLCDAAADALAALERGAEFLAMRVALPSDVLIALCAAANVPVYARDLPLAQAWELGASGVSEIGL